MKVNLEKRGKILIFRISGDIDINTAPDLKDSFDKIIKGDKDKVIINLSDVGYVDSSGLATLVEILKNLRTQGGKLKLTNLSAKVKGLFEITKLTQLFDILDGEEEVIRSFEE